MARDDRRKRRLSDQIKGRIAERLTAAMQRDREAFRKLGLLGVPDEEFPLDEAADPFELLRRLRDRVREVWENPSLLADLDLKAVEVLGAQPERPALEKDSTDPGLTVVFTDLEGFTAFTREAGDARAGSLLTDHYAVVDEIVAGRGGTVVKRLGDGHLTTFPHPRAAVLASLELVDASPDRLPLRAGGHVGEVVRLGDDVFGNVVNLASRVADAADGGQALVTVEIRDQASPVPGAAFGEPQEARLKGIEDRVPLCEVVRA